MALCFVLVSCTPKRMRGRRPTKAREQIVVPPVSCPDLFEYTAELGVDVAAAARKSQHNMECKKYFECVSNGWIARDCPDGTTFNNEDKGCDSLKACRPSIIDELYIDSVEELKAYLSVEETDTVLKT